MSSPKYKKVDPARVEALFRAAQSAPDDILDPLLDLSISVADRLEDCGRMLRLGRRLDGREARRILVRTVLLRLANVQSELLANLEVLAEEPSTLPKGETP